MAHSDHSDDYRTISFNGQRLCLIAQQAEFSHYPPVFNDCTEREFIRARVSGGNIVKLDQGRFQSFVLGE